MWDRWRPFSPDEAVPMQSVDRQFCLTFRRETGNDRIHDGFDTFTRDLHLRDYYRLRTLGVNFISKPEYLSVGLSVQFKDPSGNVFALFEQRDYSN